jgi:hypothetical protein
VEHDRGVRPLILLAIGFVAVRALAEAHGAPAFFALGQVLWALACLLAAGFLVRHALRRGPVDSERIFAALDAYLLAAAAFGVGYWLLDRFAPGSIGPDTGASLRAPDALYLSLVTITTLGLGDLVPLSPTARSIAAVEALGGQMYLAVLVARLVSLYAAAGAREK